MSLWALVRIALLLEHALYLYLFICYGLWVLLASVAVLCLTQGFYLAIMGKEEENRYLQLYHEILQKDYAVVFSVIRDFFA